MNDAQMRDAARLFLDFVGRNPEHVDLVHIPSYDVLLKIGHCTQIEYEAERDGERGLFIHKFQHHARPVLAASHDGRQLYLLAGAYRFTSRGIVDERKRK